MKKINKNYIIIILSIAIAIFGIIGFILLDEPFTLYAFRYYTYCSNFLAIFESLVFAGAVAKVIKEGEGYKINRFNYMFQYIVTIALTLTILIVFTVLMPLYGKGALEHYVTGHIRSLSFHFINPILSIVVFILSRDLYVIKKKDMFLAVVPTLIYAGILLVLNIMKLIDGPYAFLKVYDQPVYMSIIWIIIILGIAFLLSFIYYKINIYKNKNIRR